MEIVVALTVVLLTYVTARAAARFGYRLLAAAEDGRLYWPEDVTDVSDRLGGVEADVLSSPRGEHAP